MSLVSAMSVNSLRASGQASVLAEKETEIRQVQLVVKVARLRWKEQGRHRSRSRKIVHSIVRLVLTTQVLQDREQRRGRIIAEVANGRYVLRAFWGPARSFPPLTTLLKMGGATSYVLSGDLRVEPTDVPGGFAELISPVACWFRASGTRVLVSLAG